MPWFQAWIGLDCISPLLLYVLFRDGTRHQYFVAYWDIAVLDLLLQLAVVLEMAHNAFARGGRWFAGVRTQFAVLVGTAPLIALLVAALVTPAAETRIDAYFARANLFMTVLVCLILSAIMSLSQRFGLGWRTAVLRQSYGLVVWTLGSFLADTLHAYWRMARYFDVLENTRTLMIELVAVYWILVFWSPESVPTKLDSHRISELEALHSRLHSVGSSTRTVETSESPR